MATIKIIIKDNDDGTVSFESNPPFAEIVSIMKSPTEPWSAAYDYALTAINSVLARHKETPQDAVNPEVVQ